jgi:acyl transferase domain-containing protein/NAD(P)-dependent dehydrogenase (short-subunit alcohol dehydrogenase family)/acyl carrier protein/NRPS condensation-like uncharacterized protein
MMELNTGDDRTGLEIAVIGMAGRFPGAENIHEFWENLVNGKESISFFSDEELKESGIEPGLLDNSRYVRAFGWLEDIEYFDSSFFGYTPLEAEIMDPQVRIFHECAFAALEDAGHDVYTTGELVGVYAGASACFYWQVLVEMSGKNNILGRFASKQFNDKDFLATRLAYRLNLKGPAVTVDTACSTSLVAIHMACQGLLSGDCDMALAGGATIIFLKKEGYLQQEGMVHSPDGHCRAFALRASGSNFGNGVGIVVLKRLGDALENGDHIYAIIRGSSINNDGTGKATYTAPGVEGQAAVIKTAHRMAEVDPESITYVETHGTGTILGDQVEIEALRLAFNSEKRHFCRIGSVKTNVGHLETAAGAAGFIKTVLALKHRLIPPSLHVETPNPKIGFENSPFCVNTGLTEWKRDKYPLRAGVSSFGIGGTNAHVILEEWPEGAGRREQRTAPRAGRSYQLILLSARTRLALDKMTENLGNHLKENPGINLADAAHTLQTGRSVFKHRRLAVCPDVNETIDILLEPDSGKVKTFCSKEDNRPIVYMFSGLGSQYVDMGRDLYRGEAAFGETMDRCFEILSTLVDFDLKEILYPPPGNSSQEDGSVQRLDQPEISQAAIFVFEYALAQLLIRWGIKPDAMIGYSFGEYAAACISGVFSLEDAIKLVVLRGQLIRELPPGLMLSVPLSRDELVPLLNKELSLAIDNGYSCIVGGPTAAVEAFASELKQKGYLTMRLDAVRAIHSRMMDPIVKEMEEQVGRIRLNKPSIPYISNVTGNWITEEQAVDPGYWIKHLRETVQFASGMRELIKESNSLFIEIGPGRDISTLARRYLEEHDAYRLFNLVRHPHQQVSDVYFLVDKIGKLWLYGQKIAWNEFNSGEKRQRVPLPTYPFERQRYWIDEASFESEIGMIWKKSRLHKKADFDDWFYIPSWKRSVLSSSQTARAASPSAQANVIWLFFMDECGIGTRLLEQIQQEGNHVIILEAGDEFVRNSGGSDPYLSKYKLAPGIPGDYEALFAEICARGKIPGRVVHLWNITKGNDLKIEDIDKYLARGFYSLIHLAQAIGKQNIKEHIEIVVLTNGMQDAAGDEELCPIKSTVLGPVMTIPREYPNIDCRSIDVILPGEEPRREKRLVGQLLKEIKTDSRGKPGDNIIAYRSNHRWVRTFEPVRLPGMGIGGKITRLREKGIYLVTGGLGGIGLVLAEHLAKTVRAKLVLTGRSEIPGRERWDRWLRVHPHEDASSRKIRKILELERTGAEVLFFTADAADYRGMETVISEVEKQWGKINGIIHAAGVVGGGMIQGKTRDVTERVLLPKVKGTLVLDTLMKEVPLDFFLLCSSVNSILPLLGQVDYCAANAFLDAFAYYKTPGYGTVTISVNWDTWQEVGMAAEAARQLEKSQHIKQEDMLKKGILPAEGIDAFNRLLEEALPQVVVSTTDLPARIDNINISTAAFLNVEDESPGGISPSPAHAYSRPTISSEYVSPATPLQETLAGILQDILGIRQVGIEDDFFELGGDSLKAISVAGRILKKLGIEMTLAEFFDRPTIVKLAQYVAGVKPGLTAGTDANGKYIPVNEREPYTHALPLIEEKEYYDLTPSQRRFWILEQIYKGDEIFNIPLYHLLTGNLNLADFKKTFYSLVQRHESLRTVFTQVNGEPKQKIHKTLKQIPFDYLDFRDVESESLDKLVEKEIVNKSNKPFDLEKGPLFEVTLIRKKEEEYLFMFNIHHVIFDKLSLYVLLKELFLLYPAFCRGEENPLEEMRIQYRDYAGWLNNVLSGESLKELEEYWLGNLGGQIPGLELPTDRPRLINQGMQAAKLTFYISPEIVKKIDALSKRYSITFFMVQLAFVYVLIYKYTGQTDIVFTSFISGRNHRDLEQLMGYLVNLLAIRIHMKPGYSFADVVREVKEITLKSYEHQLYSYEDLLELLHVNREEDRALLSKIRVDVKDAVPGTDYNLEVKGLKIKALMDQPAYSEIYKEDLYFCFTRYDSRIKVEIEYYADMFDRSRIELMRDRYIDLIEKLLKDENTWISHIDFTVPTEKELAEDLDVEFNI